MKVVRSVLLGKIAVIVYFFELPYERYDFSIMKDRVFDRNRSIRNRLKFGGVVEELELDFSAMTAGFLVKRGV